MKVFNVLLYFLIVIYIRTIYGVGFDYRLSKSVLPEVYDITIKPYLLPEDGVKQFTFDGAVNITLHAEVNNVLEITLHSDMLTIMNVTLSDNFGNIIQNIEPANLWHELETNKIKIPLKAPLVVNERYNLQFLYEGKIRDGMAGLYRASYIDSAGKNKSIGLTQLQRIDARTLFPCFDEPAYKAKFRMHISRPRHYNAVFNTRLAYSEPDGDNRYMDTFEETPPMSTYLVAFVLSEFVVRNESNLFLIMRSEFYNKTDFSFNVSVNVLMAYNEYTKISYETLGNPILQFVASPKFPHNGMENWGLVIFKDQVLVHEPGYTDGWSNKQYTISIIVHETAHMWFGNSVTFDWWSYFWLNEAFARYYQFFMAHELYPEYQLDQQFIVDQMHTIFERDALNTTQPMTSPEASVQTPYEIGEKFSAIAYAKGACIVRMIRGLMGGDNFDAAIRTYLKTNHLSNTKPDHLFQQLKLHWPSDHDVNLDTFFDDWTEQVGFPVLFVNISNDRRALTIQQRRFLLDFDDQNIEQNISYTIPITFTTNIERNFNDLKPSFYLEKTKQAYTWYNGRAIKWAIFNLQQSNYYRVFYDEYLLKELRRALMQESHSGVHVNNRAQLVNDLLNYGRSGMLDYAKVFEFLEYLANETAYLPWHAAFTGFQLISQRLNAANQQHFGKFIFDISKRVYKILNFHNDNDTVLDVYNRNRVIYWLCKYGHNDCKTGTEKLFLIAQNTDKKPTPDFRETLYCSAARRGAFDFYNTLEKWYALETRIEEQELLLRAMGCTINFLDYQYARILSALVPRSQKTVAFSAIYKENAENVTPLFHMVARTVEKFTEELDSWSNTADVIYDMADHFTNTEQQLMLEEFIEEKGGLFGTSVDKLHAAVENVKKNLKWSEKRLPGLVTYLNQRNNASEKTLASLILPLTSFLVLCMLKI